MLYKVTFGYIFKPLSTCTLSVGDIINVKYVNSPQFNLPGWASLPQCLTRLRLLHARCLHLSAFGVQWCSLQAQHKPPARIPAAGALRWWPKGQLLTAT